MIIIVLNLTHNAYGSSICKIVPSRAKKKFSHEAWGQAKFFLHIVGHSRSAFVNQPGNNCIKIHHMSFNHITGDGSRKTESIRQKFPMSRITRKRYKFIIWIITQNNGKLFNCGTKYSSFKLEHVIFRILEFHSNMKEIPLHFYVL